MWRVCVTCLRGVSVCRYSNVRLGYGFTLGLLQVRDTGVCVCVCVCERGTPIFVVVRTLYLSLSLSLSLYPSLFGICLSS